jgi:hypothetical protein
VVDAGILGVDDVGSSERHADKLARKNELFEDRAFSPRGPSSVRRRAMPVQSASFAFRQGEHCLSSPGPALPVQCQSIRNETARTSRGRFQHISESAQQNRRG